MFAYRTPGVYFEWQDSRENVPAVQRTDIAGFVGIAARGPLHRPVRVQSWTQFTSIFGAHIPQGYLAYAVEGFFANGGRTCWVVRVADAEAAKSAELTLVEDRRDEDGNGYPALYLQASSPGVWADLLRVRVLRAGARRFSLVVNDETGDQEIWRDLDLLPHAERVLNDAALGSQWVRADVIPAANTIPIFELGRRVPLAGEYLLSGGTATTPAEVTVPDNFSGQAMRIRASAAGEWGNALYIRVSSGDTGVFNFAVRLDAQQETWTGLSLACRAERSLNDDATGSLWLRARLLPPPVDGGAPVLGARNLQAGSYGLQGGADGLATLALEHLIGGSSPTPCRGLACLASVDEVNQLAVPDLMPTLRIVPEFKEEEEDCSILDGEASADTPTPQPPEFPPVFNDLQILQGQQAMILQCETLRDRMAMLDPPPSVSSREAILSWRANFDTSYAALYFPWVLAPDPLQLQSLVRATPPSGQLAGIYARNDQASGVQRAPGNWQLIDAKAVTVTLDEVLHGELNDRQINVIRRQSEGNIRVQGGRTLSSDTNLRYINVRRLLLMVAETLDERSQELVFEPNNPDLWQRIDILVSAYLDGIWRRGMLDGSRPEDAYSVKCDEETNPPSSIDEGKVICEVGLNLPWPAEFIIVRIGFTSTGVELQGET